jgi:hypothetical protein
VSHPFKSYEVEVLKLLLRDEFAAERLLRLLSNASAPHVEYTNYGFYVSVQNSVIGKTRRVHSGPTTLSARFGSHSAGFVAFLQDDKLTLETFPWDGEQLPATFRDLDVKLFHQTTNDNV